MEHDELIPGLPEEIAIECLIRVPPFHCYKLGIVQKLWKSAATIPYFTHRRSQLQASLSKKNMVKPGRREGKFMILLQEEDHMINDNIDGNKEEMIIKKNARLVLYDIVKRDWWCKTLAGNFPAANLPNCCVISLTGENLVVMGDLTVREPPPQLAWASRTTGPSVWVYNFSSSIKCQGWREGTPVPGPPRLLFAHASDGLGTIFVAGGWNPVSDEPLRSAMAYDVEQEEWIPLPPMIQKRAYCYGTFFDNKLYVANNSCCCEVLDLTTFSWSLSVPPEQDSIHKQVDPETYHHIPLNLPSFPEINTFSSPGVVWLLTKPLTKPHALCAICQDPNEGDILLRAWLDHEHSHDEAIRFIIAAKLKKVEHIAILPEKYWVAVRGVSLTNFLLPNFAE
ncbi:hypothetical protein H6P81_018809 [Aristolochia fimbriata]|uniref:F-box/kelch-repeat protein n=1 Tax=Aristolochia fimbriata TaxID=158543 RepID=A0AAV7E235_ARIFI|nr:hypothetical protein H6P81_018809 [Aristolochia fimbriata]